MGREVRMVPPTWEHPRHENGQFIALYEGSWYEESVADWDEEKAAWDKGLIQNNSAIGTPWIPIDPEYAGMAYEEFYKPRPSPDGYMPVWTPEEATHYMMYEDMTQGTPISPAFSTPEALARWLTDNNTSAFGGMTATYEAWLRVARGEFAPSAVFTPQTGLISGVQAAVADLIRERDEAREAQRKMHDKWQQVEPASRRLQRLQDQYEKTILDLRAELARVRAALSAVATGERYKESEATNE